MKTQSLHSQFRLWTVLLVIVPSLLIMIIYTVEQITLARQQNLELISQRVSSQARLVDYWLAERAVDIEELSESDAFRSLDERRMSRNLFTRQKLNNNFDSLSFIDRDGYFRISTLSTGIRFPSASAQEYYKQALEGKTHISDIVIGRNSGVPLMNFSSPVYDYNYEFQGLILGSVRTTTLETLLRENWVGQTGEILLVNREGVMLTEPRFIKALIDKGDIGNSAIMKAKLSDEALRQIRIGQSGVATWVDYRGNTVMGAYQYMPDRGWTLIGKIDEEEVLAPIYRQIATMAGGTLLIVFLILPLASRLTMRFKQPVDWLIGQSKLIATENYAMVGRDDFSKNIPNELAVLCEAFVTMSRKVEETIGLLKDNESKLESKISELDAVNQELESFSYSVSHDLRAPLRSIDGFSQALLEDYADKLDEKGTDYLRRVRLAAQKMAALIDDLINLSRVSRTEMRKEVIDISSMVQTINEEYQRARPERQVELIVQPSLFVLADRSLLRIMLSNLIDNAWKYTSKTAGARIEFGLTQVDGKDTFFLRDNGVGFDMTYADKLFAPFQRLHSAVDFPGTGIGLATVLRIINRHGGKIWAAASPNAGAVFYFKV